MEWVNWKFDEDVRGKEVETIEIKALLWICTDSENVVEDLSCFSISSNKHNHSSFSVNIYSYS